MVYRLQPGFPGATETRSPAEAGTPTKTVTAKKAGGDNRAGTNVRPDIRRSARYLLQRDTPEHHNSGKPTRGIIIVIRPGPLIVQQIDGNSSVRVHNRGQRDQFPVIIINEFLIISPP